MRLALRELRRMPGRFFAVGTALMVIAVLVLVLGAILDEGFAVGDVVALPGDVEVEIVATIRDATTNLAPSLWVDLATWREVTVAARPDAGLAEGAVQALNVVVEDGRDPLEVALFFVLLTLERRGQYAVLKAIGASPRGPRPAHRRRPRQRRRLTRTFAADDVRAGLGGNERSETGDPVQKIRTHVRIPQV